jgi:hypothetical protein
MNYKNNLVNCVTNVQCEPKTRRLAKSNYQRPKKTYTDTLQTNAAMKEKLKNYVQVDDIEDVNITTHVRYVTLKDGQQRFCLGGLLRKIHPKYVVLSNGTFSWSVQRYHYGNDNDSEPGFETVFFRILSKQEQQQHIIEEQQKELEQLKKKLGTYGKKKLHG